MSVTINEGTSTDIYSVANAGTEIQVIKLDVGAGTAISDFGGTVRDVANLSKGTVTKLEGGTVNVNMLSGTLNVGTVANAGTVVEVNKGTINLGTVAVSNTPNIGTVTTLPGIPSGTINVGTFTNTGTTINVATGTQQTLGTVGVVNNLIKGTITALETGTLTALAVGTVGGKAASGAAAVANPILIAGTDAGGTVYTPVVTSAGALSVSGASAGTFVNVVTGTQQTLGTVGVVNSIAELVKGTVTLSNPTGTVVEINKGTINLGTVAISNTPTVNVATGTINVGTATVSGNVGVSTGTITTGSITNVASLHTGTITTGSITNVAMVHAGTHVHPTGTVTTIAAGTQNTVPSVFCWGCKYNSSGNTEYTWYC